MPHKSPLRPLLTFFAATLALAGCGTEPGPNFGPPPSYDLTAGADAWQPAVDRRSAEQDAQFRSLAMGGMRRTEGVDETLYVERAGFVVDAAQRTTAPGSGEAVATVDDVEVRLPLEHTEVRLDVLGTVVAGSVRQRFANPYDRAIEVVYVFPLPQDAAVHDFVLTIGERRIRGVVREREEARRLYEAALAQGHTASLLSQERPNVFTQKVANLAPGHGLDVELAYLEAVDHADGWQELAFPMVVGPRYNPVGWERGIGAVAAGDADARPTASGQPTDVTYLRPGQRSGHDIALTVALRVGVAVAALESPSHAVTIEERSDATLVRLAPSATLPNADFRLRWRVRGDGLRTSLVRQGAHALLTLYPPDDLASLPRRPTEHVFVLDTSGSMRGEPLAVVKRAMRAALGRLAPEDTFDLLRFGSRTGALAEQPLAANATNLNRARAWLDELQAGGGTEMLPALTAALQRPTTGGRVRVITFLTDGFIGNEEQIFTAIQQRASDVKIFAFGIGSSPNRWLIAEMGARSGGAAATFGLDEDPTEAIEAYFDRASRPAVQGLRLAWSGARADAASEVPNELLVGRPVTISFALEPRGADSQTPTRLTVQGRVDGAWREVASVSATDGGDAAPGTLAKVWARARLGQLAADARVARDSEREALGARMTRLALEHGLVSAFTSFLAVDSAEAVTDGGAPTRVDVAVPLPAGVRFETTVSGG